jgi:hypothetical protein
MEFGLSTIGINGNKYWQCQKCGWALHDVAYRYIRFNLKCSCCGQTQLTGFVCVDSLDDALEYKRKVNGLNFPQGFT